MERARGPPASACAPHQTDRFAAKAEHQLEGHHMMHPVGVSSQSQECQDKTGNDALGLDEVKQQKNKTPPQECRVCICH